MSLFLSAECPLFLEKQSSKERKLGTAGVYIQVLASQICIYRKWQKKNWLLIELPREVMWGRTSDVDRKQQSSWKCHHVSAAFLAEAGNIIVALKREISGNVVKEVNVPETHFPSTSIAAGLLPSQPAPHCLASVAHWKDSTAWLRGKLNYLELIERLLGYLIVLMTHLQFPPACGMCVCVLLRLEQWYSRCL